MRIQKRILVSLLGGAMLAGCSDLNVTNPNQQNSSSAWQQADALNALAATYNALLELGVFGRWQAFDNDIRSDIGTARTSPWGDLANFNAFILANYDFEVNRETWANNFDMIGRANVVIARAPTATMDSTLRAQYIGEAKFLRALAYYNLVTLYENVPLVLEPQTSSSRPTQATAAEVYAQIEKDLTEAAAVMDDATPIDARGHATKWAALAMLGRVRLQEAGVLNINGKWAEASQSLAQVIGSGNFSLLTNYADNFKLSMDDANPESIFEVENEDMYPIGVTGVSFPKMIGPCYRAGKGRAEYNPTFCDGRPTRWYFNEFARSKTATGGVDPRMDVTLMYNRPDLADEQVYGRPRSSYFVNSSDPTETIRADTMIFFRKYGEWATSSDQRWDNPINYKVIRYADVLLMQAEALNQSGQTPQAFQYINLVRARAQKSPLAGLSQAQLRDSILYERMLELGLESSRFNDLRRYGLLTPALVAHDADFSNFQTGKSERLPIPTTETNLNPNLHQNPGW